MSSFDYNAPAELFLSKPAKGCRTKYRRFATAAEALRYAVEDLRTPKAFGAWLARENVTAHRELGLGTYVRRLRNQSRCHR
jgi:hypothetical protein